MRRAPSPLAELLAECDSKGIRLLPVEDGGLTIDAPQGAVTPDLLGRVKAYKAELLTLLASQHEHQHEQHSASVKVSFAPSCLDGQCSSSMQRPANAKTADPWPVIEGHEHFNLWIATTDSPWPEFIAGYHWDICQPSRLRGLLCYDAEPAPLIDLPTNASPVCRCRSTSWCGVPIHYGQSVRRDCVRCGRFIDFSIWYGKDTLQNG